MHEREIDINIERVSEKDRKRKDREKVPLNKDLLYGPTTELKFCDFYRH